MPQCKDISDASFEGQGAWEGVNTHVPAQVLEAVRILVLRQVARLFQDVKEGKQDVGGTVRPRAYRGS